MSDNHAVGSKISLISKSEIRYEGFLNFISAEENTVGLRNVRMFGTEGRKGDPKFEIPAADTLYEFIIFRGADIKDLTVFEDQPRDPAIVSAQPARQQPSQAAPAAASGRQAHAAAPQRVVAQAAAPAPAAAAPAAHADRRQGDKFYDRPHDKSAQPQPRRDDRRFERWAPEPEAPAPPPAPASRRGWEQRPATAAPAAAAPAAHHQPQTGGGRGGYQERRGGGAPAAQPQHQPQQQQWVDRGGRGGGRGGAGRGFQQQQQPAAAHHHQAAAAHGGAQQQQQGRRQYPQDRHQQQFQQRPQSAPAVAAAAAAAPAGGASTQQPRLRGPQAHTGQFTVAIDQKAKDELTADFDFHKSAEEFHRRKTEFEAPKAAAAAAEGAAAATAPAAAMPVVGPKYDKASSFFDNISCETTERLAKRKPNPREDREHQASVDTETFGRDAVGAVRHSFRHGGRGRGRYGDRR